MLFREEWSLTYTVVILRFLAQRVSASQSCSTERLEDVVIDIQLSLPRGIRGSEPMHTATQEGCLTSCCSTANIAGDKACNLMIFNTQKMVGRPNCYLFFCPSEGACPLKPAKGLMSYRVIRDFPSLTSAGLPHQESMQSDSVLRGPSSPGVPETLPPLTGHPRPTTNPAQRAALSQKSGPSSSPQRPVEAHPAITASEGRSRPQGPRFSPDLEVVRPLPGEATPFPAPGAWASPRVSAPRKPAVLPPSSASRPPAGTVWPQVASTAPPVTTVPSQRPMAPASMVLGRAAFAPRAETAAGLTTSFQGHQDPVPLAGIPGLTTAGPGGNSAPLSLSPAAAATNRTTSRGCGEVGVGSWSLSSAPQSQRGLPLEKWLLMGTLLFGVLFLVTGLVLLGRMLAESLRRKPYSRLDYLINGIYVDT